MHVSVSETFAQGVSVTLWGMGLVFLALVLIAVLIWALDRIFRPAPEEAVAPPKQAAPAARAAAPSLAVAASEDSSVAAAVAAVAATRAALADEIAAIAAAIMRARQVPASGDPFRRAARSSAILDGETVFVATIDSGPGTWKQHGRLKALQQ